MWRYDLNKSRALLETLGAEIPNLPPYDPAKDEKLPWEDAAVAAIKELRTEKAAKAAAEPPKTSASVSGRNLGACNMHARVDFSSGALSLSS